jgi:hypothetical protein
MHRARYLIDVLTAGTLGAHGGERHFISLNFQITAPVACCRW